MLNARDLLRMVEEREIVFVPSRRGDSEVEMPVSKNPRNLDRLLKELYPAIRDPDNEWETVKNLRFIGDLETLDVWFWLAIQEIHMPVATAIGLDYWQSSVGKANPSSASASGWTVDYVWEYEGWPSGKAQIVMSHPNFHAMEKKIQAIFIGSA